MTVKSLIKKLQKVKDKSSQVWIADLNDASFTKVRKVEVGKYNKRKTLDIIYDARLNARK